MIIRDARWHKRHEKKIKRRQGRVHVPFDPKIKNWSKSEIEQRYKESQERAKQLSTLKKTMRWFLRRKVAQWVINYLYQRGERQYHGK